MAPLVIIDPNVDGWEAEQQAARALRAANGAGDDDSDWLSSSSDDDDERVMLPGRPVRLDDDEEIVQRAETNFDRAAISQIQASANAFTTVGIHGARWTKHRHYAPPRAFTSFIGVNRDMGRGRRRSEDGNARPIDYWKKFVTDGMLDAIVESTKQRVKEHCEGVLKRVCTFRNLVIESSLHGCKGNRNKVP